MESAPPILVRYNTTLSSSTALPKTARARERELQSVKWFDYRYISPAKATNLFRDEFIRVYQSFYGRHVDSAEAENRFGCRTGPWSLKDFLVFTRARQFADSLSVPYRHFLWTAFEHLVDSGWQRLPKANQLYGKNAARIAEVVTEEWHEKCQTFVQFSAVAAYRTENFRSLPDQQAHRRWMIEQLRSTGSSAHTLARLCFVHRVLPDEVAVAEFGSELLAQARDIAAGLDKGPDADEIGPLLPACIGLGEPDPSCTPCDECKMVSLCLNLGKRVERALVSKYKTDDPITQKKRSDTAMRVRKHRAKKKALLAASPSLKQPPLERVT